MGAVSPRPRAFVESAAIIAAVLCALIVTVRLLIAFLNPGYMDTADRFFADVQAGHFAQAYARTASETRRDLSLQSFEEFLHKTGLDSFDSARWEDYGVLENGTAELRGVAVIRPAKSNERTLSRALRLVFDYSKGHWAIRTIE